MTLLERAAKAAYTEMIDSHAARYSLPELGSVFHTWEQQPPECRAAWRACVMAAFLAIGLDRIQMTFPNGDVVVEALGGPEADTPLEVQVKP